MRCVAPSPSAGIDWARSSQTSNSVARKSSRDLPASGLADDRARPRRAVRQQDHRIVRTHVPIDTDAVERFVHCIDQRRLRVLHPERGIGHDERQHRGHVGPDHRGTFGNARDARRHAADRYFAAAHLRHRVGRHTCRGPRSRATARRRPAAGRRFECRPRIFSIGIIEPITPVDITSACSAVTPHASAAQAAICRASRVALVARAGVGDARVDHHDADRIARCPLAIELHRGGTHEILRVHARRHGRPIGHHQRQIKLLVVALHAGINTGGSKTYVEGGDSCDRIEWSFEIGRFPR